MSVVFGGGPLASRRTHASIAKASITRLTCRCQPCHERLSLWASPSSVLAVSNASSIARAPVLNPYQRLDRRAGRPLERFRFGLNRLAGVHRET